MTGKKDNRLGWTRGIAHALIGTSLAALPLAGLVFFFELTRPVALSSQSLRLAESTVDTPAMSGALASRMPIVRFHGVSAELNASAGAAASPQTFSASDARRVFASLSPSALCPGFESEFVSKEGRRVAVRIVNRAPAGDQIIPDRDQLMAATPASTSNLVSFVWGPWLYRAELEDRGAAPEVVVQKIL